MASFSPLSSESDRRRFLQHMAMGGLVASPLGRALAADAPVKPQAPAHTLTVIEGKPRERGRRYGRIFKSGIQAFLDKEILGSFTDKPNKRADIMGYAQKCAEAVRRYCPIIHSELEGMADGSGIDLQALTAITLHEELYHRRLVPGVEHCTAVAIGPPETADGHTYVGQTWDWMESVYGLSTMLKWQRPEGPSLLAYGYPGLWVGAGLNSAGLALTWTTAGMFHEAHKQDKGGPVVGLPSYVLLTHILYQDSLDKVIAEVKRVPRAGWFTFVVADGKGRMASIEGSPREVAVELHEGKLTRVDYGTRQMARAEPVGPVSQHPRSQRMYDLLGKDGGRLDAKFLQSRFGDPKAGICGSSTIDMMVFDTTARRALVSRGPHRGATWREFTFDSRGS